MDSLLWITWSWHQPDQLTPTEIIELVALDHFLHGLPDTEWRTMGMKAARTPRDMVTALECTFFTLEMGRREKRTSFQHEPCYLSSQNLGISRRAQPSPQDKLMLTEPEQRVITPSCRLF